MFDSHEMKVDIPGYKRYFVRLFEYSAAGMALRSYLQKPGLQDI